MGKNGRDPQKDYAAYVDEALLAFPWWAKGSAMGCPGCPG
jgi:hypothetical protein